MRAEEQISRHLLLAVIATVFSGVLGLVVLVMDWELWMLPLMTAGCFSVWILHIARLGSNTFYENLSAGLMLIEFFFSVCMNPVFLMYPPSPAFWFYPCSC